jgi:hypothetical protein
LVDPARPFWPLQHHKKTGAGNSAGFFIPEDDCLNLAVLDLAA